MTKAAWGGTAPLLLAGLVLLVVTFTSPQPPVASAIRLGLLIALVQSYLSTAALHWAWKTKFFYWVWGSGVLSRIVVFAATAFGVYRYTNLSLVAAMCTLVGATTVFLVIESATFSQR